MTIDLSPRESQVMQMISEGYTTEFIAYQLGISVKVVRGYVNNVLHKLDAHCREEAIAKLVALGLVTVNVKLTFEPLTTI